MELTVRPNAQNTAPLGGILLMGGTAERWLRAIQAMGLSLSGLTAYALPRPGTTEGWGCLLTGITFPINDIGQHHYCQLVDGLLFIPEKAVLYPPVSAADLDKLLLSRPHFLHPETGLVELVRPLNWSDLLTTPAERAVAVTTPAPTVFVPMQVRSFRVQATPPEAVLERLEEQFPRRERADHKPLNLLEQARRLLYGQLLGKPGVANPSPLLNALANLRERFTGKNDNWIEQLTLDQAELEKRNQQQLDRLLDLLKKDPGEALKYAIPLDENGTGRGSDNALLRFSLRWLNFSLFDGIDGSSRSGGTSVLPDSSYQRLQDQYIQTAQALIGQREFLKAAFVYLKLLKNYSQAAQTLETGKLFAEAASVWLKYVRDKTKAAECYEKAAMTLAAIDLYNQLGQHEKAGDLYVTINQPHEARLQYNVVISQLTGRGQFVKAALIYRHKLHDAAGSQSLLLTGWRGNKDAYNCLNNYLAALTDPNEVDYALQDLYANEVNETNRETFVQVLRHEYTRHPTLADAITDLAHELIVAQLPTNPAIASELRFFGKPDKQLVKDIMRFRNNAKTPNR